jgi:hypothetical protein
MAPVLEGKSIGSDQNTVLKGERLIWRTKNQARYPGTLQLKDSICFTRPGTQVHSNSRIQFASHEFKWFLGNWTLDPRLKWALMVFYCKSLFTPYVENHNQHD